MAERGIKIALLMNEEDQPVVSCFDEDFAEIKKILEMASPEIKIHKKEIKFMMVGDGHMMSVLANALTNARAESRGPRAGMIGSPMGGMMGRPGMVSAGGNDPSLDVDGDPFDDSEDDAEDDTEEDDAEDDTG